MRMKEYWRRQIHCCKPSQTPRILLLDWRTPLLPAESHWHWSISLSISRRSVAQRSWKCSTTPRCPVARRIEWSNISQQLLRVLFPIRLTPPHTHCPIPPPLRVLYLLMVFFADSSQCCQKVRTVSKSPHGHFSPDNSMDKFQKTLWKIAFM